MRKPEVIFSPTLSMLLWFGRLRSFAGQERELYDQLHALLAQQVPRPDLVVYLQATTDELLHRIESRNIDYERQMERDYLDRVNEAYKQYFFDYAETPLLVISTTDINFVDHPDDFDDVLRQTNLGHRRPRRPATTRPLRVLRALRGFVSF